MTPAPTLITERLTLRMPALADFDPIAAYHASDRSRHEGGPNGRVWAWRVWASDVALWHLKGYGPFAVDDRATGAFVGEVGIFHAEGYPEPELGWFVTPQAEGQGFATEAARAVLDWLRGAFAWPDVTSIIDPENHKSIALGLRLGGRIDATRPGIDPGDIVIVHPLRGQA